MKFSVRALIIITIVIIIQIIISKTNYKPELVYQCQSDSQIYQTALSNIDIDIILIHETD